MGHRLTSCLLALALMVVGMATARASLSDYSFSATTQTMSPLTSYSTLLSSYNSTSSITGTYGDSAISSSISIGFPFKFDCGTYNYFSANASGTVTLGTSTAPRVVQRYDALNASRTYPIIAPLWMWQHLYSGYCVTTAVRYYRSGSSPNRVLTIEWQTQIVGVSGGVPSYYWIGCSTSMLQYQVKLYEGTNKIEFLYGRISHGGIPTSATIGLGLNSFDWISVTPGSTATASMTDLNNSIDLTAGDLTAGTMFSFTPVGEMYVGLTGPGNGGTVDMLTGDTLFNGFTEQVGNAGVYTPLTISRSCPAGTASYSFDITGPAASNYAFVANGTQNLSTGISGGSSYTPAIRFVPTGNGTYDATLRVRNLSNSTSRVYYLHAGGTARIVYVGDPSQGGTLTAADGDEILTNVQLPRSSTGVYRPFRIDNTNPAPNYLTAPVNVTVTIDSSGTSPMQYHLIEPGTGLPVSTLTVAIGPSESFTPEIQFTAIGAGEQDADLIITTDDGENRTFELAAVSIAPGGTFVANGEQLASSLQFSKTESCVGASSTYVPVTITSIGRGVPLRVESVQGYLLDTVYGQGRPPQPLLLVNGQPVPMNDYVLSDVAGSARPADRTQFPIVLQPGQSRTVYLTFVSSLPGKRYARFFVNSNAQNFGADDTAGVRRNGLLSFEAIGSGVGGVLASDLNGSRVLPAVFPITRVRDSSIATIMIANPGLCDLRISSRHLYITNGDVGEFRVLRAMPNSPKDPVTGDYILPAGGIDSIMVSFKPTRGGSRMATLWMRTNDSTIASAAGDLRGEVFLDLYGTATAGLDGRDLVMNPVVIGGSTTDFVVLENSITTPIMIDRIELQGPDAAEFSASTTTPWPTLPARVLPGDKLRLSVTFAPQGLPGDRSAEMIVVTGTGDTTRLSIRAEAGTQDLVVGPASLFDGVAVPVGQSVRKTVMISNAGTLPVRLVSVKITGVDDENYRMGAMPRMDLEPGTTEFLEITFAPEEQGESSAELVVQTSTTTKIVPLRGTALQVRGGGNESDESPSTEPRRPGVPEITSSADDAAGTGRMRLGPARPNPAHDVATFDLRLDGDRSTRIDLVDIKGRTVWSNDLGVLSAGIHRLTLPVSELSAGFYQARVICGDHVFVGSVIVD